MTAVRQLFQYELDALRERVVTMGSMVDKALARAVDALRTLDVNLAREVVKNDLDINRYRWETEDEATRVIATQAPLAGDLRAVISVFSIVTDLERMGDHAVSIARYVIDTAAEPPLKKLVDLPRMAEIGREMLRDSLAAFVQGDVDAANRIITRDDEVDALFEQVSRELLTYMLADPMTIDRATRLIAVGHNLERVGDRVENICERVIYAATGAVETPA
ncbi:MAG: phosphate signaling complex protein PhoU [Thermomicrobiales bacterium]|nr:phosphate signaling complex protein PhoU [Thermomicrobiales bacterium]